MWTQTSLSIYDTNYCPSKAPILFTYTTNHQLTDLPAMYTSSLSLASFHQQAFSKQPSAPHYSLSGGSDSRSCHFPILFLHVSFAFDASLVSSNPEKKYPLLPSFYTSRTHILYQNCLIHSTTNPCTEMSTKDTPTTSSFPACGVSCLPPVLPPGTITSSSSRAHSLSSKSSERLDALLISQFAL